MKGEKEEKKIITITKKDLIDFLGNKKMVLDCGHRFQIHPFHPLSNAIIITNTGKTLCHHCYK